MSHTSEAMGTTVYIQLRDGRRVRFGRATDAASAAKVKDVVAGWVRDGMLLSLANAHGGVDDVLPRSVASVDLADEPTPARGSARISL